MEQLIFIGVILLFSVLEAIARKGKEGQGTEPMPGELPAQRPRRPGPVPRDAEGSSGPPTRVPPAYDHDPTYDDAVEGRPGRPRTGSEGLIPAEIWDEIQRMARGEVPQAPAPAPEGEGRPAPRPVPERRPERPPEAKPGPRPQRERSPKRPRPQPAEATAPRRSTGVARNESPRPLAPRSRPAVATDEEGTADHAVHLTHAVYGTPVGGRLTGFAEGMASGGASREAQEVRALLAGGPSRLRQAVILQELLGPPLALRDDGPEGQR